MCCPRSSLVIICTSLGITLEHRATVLGSALSRRRKSAASVAPACEQVVPEPPGLASALRAVPGRQLSRGEKAAFDKDGVTVLRGVMPQGNITRYYLDACSHGHWYRVGAMRALLRDGPLPGLAASALAVPAVRIWDLNWFKMPDGNPHYHGDLKPQRADILMPFVSVWWAVTDAPQALNFLLGSHRQTLDCPSTMRKQNWGLGIPCLASVGEQLSQKLGYPVNRTYDFSSGDVAVFYMQVLHRGPAKDEFRLAVAPRFVAADAVYERNMHTTVEHSLYHRYLPPNCGHFAGPLFPIVYPPSKSTVELEPWPMLPTLEDLTLWKWRLNESLTEDRHDNCSFEQR